MPVRPLPQLPGSTQNPDVLEVFYFLQSLGSEIGTRQSLAAPVFVGASPVQLLTVPVKASNYLFVEYSFALSANTKLVISCTGTLADTVAEVGGVVYTSFSPARESTERISHGTVAFRADTPAVLTFSAALIDTEGVAGRVSPGSYVRNY